MDKEIYAPEHYTKGEVECIDAIRASMTSEAFAGFCKGNVMKYLYRYENKGRGKDLQKAQVYLQWLMVINESIEDAEKQREI